LAQDLDVHQVVADLDVVAGAADQVDLVALLDAAGGQRGEPRLGDAEPAPERPPLPPRDDARHGASLLSSRGPLARRLGESTAAARAGAAGCVSGRPGSRRSRARSATPTCRDG